MAALKLADPFVFANASNWGSPAAFRFSLGQFDPTRDYTLTFTLPDSIIGSRDDPCLPLARLRASDQLTELRAAELCFTSSEAAEFLNQVMGL